MGNVERMKAGVVTPEHKVQGSLPQYQASIEGVQCLDQRVKKMELLIQTIPGAIPFHLRVTEVDRYLVANRFGASKASMPSALVQVKGQYLPPTPPLPWPRPSGGVSHAHAHPGAPTHSHLSA